MSRPRRKQLPAFVECWRDRHGRLRTYFRRVRNGPVTPLPPLNAPEFASAYHATLTGCALPEESAPQAAVPPRSIGALVERYMASGDYRSLRSTTKAGYAYQLETLRREHGHRSVAGMTRENVKKLLAPFADKPGAALARLKMLRVLIGHGIEIGWLTSDPSLGIKRPKGGEIRSWTDAEIARFEAHWPVGSQERLAFALMLYTGQRRSDVHRMTCGDVTGTVIRVKQQKTLARLSIPLHPSLQAILAATKRVHVAMLVNGRGRALTAHSFSVWMRRAIAAAGLPLDCQPHGLRKAAARRLAECGCSAHEIMAITGHKTLAEAERYTREADQVRLANAAIGRLSGQNGDRIAQTAGDGFEQLAKNEALPVA
jgi:integrase